MTRMSCPPPNAHRPPPCVRQQLFASKIANNICRKQAGKDNNQIRNQKKSTLRKAAAQPSRPATDPEQKSGSRGQQAISNSYLKNKKNFTKNSRPGASVTGPEQNPTAQQQKMAATHNKQSSSCTKKDDREKQQPDQAGQRQALKQKQLHQKSSIHTQKAN